MLKCEYSSIHISPDNIVYCEAVGKKTRVFTHDGQTLLCDIGISGLNDLLSGDFVHCHRSYLVNLRFVRSIGRVEIRLDSGAEIPLSRRLYKEVNERFIQFYTKG